MKLKSTILILLILFSILTISSVSATDNNIHDSNLQMDNIDKLESINDENIMENSLEDDEKSESINNENMIGNSLDNQNEELEISNEDKSSENIIQLSQNDERLNENEEITNPNGGTQNGNGSDASADISSQTTQKKTISITYYKELRYGSPYFKVFTSLNKNGNVTIKIGNQQYKPYAHRKINGKKAYYFYIPILNIGKHTVSITYHGDKTYSSRTINRKFSIIPKIVIDYSILNASDTPSYKYPFDVYLQIPKAKGKLVVKFYNPKNKVVKTFSKKFVKGKAKINFYNYNFPDKYSKMVVMYTGKDYKVKKVVKKKVRILPRIKFPKEMLKGEKKYITMKFKNKNGTMHVYWNIEKNGKIKTIRYSRKVVNGKVKIPLSNFKAGSLNDIVFIEKSAKNKKVKYHLSAYYFRIVNPLEISSGIYSEEGNYIEIEAFKKGCKPLAGKNITIKINDKFVETIKTNKKGIAIYYLPSEYNSKTIKVTAEYKTLSFSKKIKVY